MADKLTPAKRSWNMSRIKGKNTKPELLVRKFLFAQGIRYRIHTTLPGRPDIVIKKKRIVIFVNGCFWHAHDNCPDYRLPKTRTDFWKAKIEGNVVRDKKNHLKLEEDDWKVLTVWECQLGKNYETTLIMLLDAIRK